MAQAGGSGLILPGPGSDSDKFTGCVARNNYLWLTQTIGIPWNGTSENGTVYRNFAQWWQIATSNLTAGYNPIRFGPNTTGTPGQPSTQYDVIDTSIAVNGELGRCHRI